MQPHVGPQLQVACVCVCVCVCVRVRVCACVQLCESRGLYVENKAPEERGLGSRGRARAVQGAFTRTEPLKAPACKALASTMAARTRATERAHQGRSSWMLMRRSSKPVCVRMAARGPNSVRAVCAAGVD